MNTIYFKNFILFGDIVYHCLLCEESFQKQDAVEKHLRWEKHRKLLKTKIQVYLPKFKRDCIYKIENYYYCELCNFVTTKMDVIITHTNEELHKKNREEPSHAIGKTRSIVPKWENNNVILSGIIISTNEWYGVLKGHCLVCNTPVKDVDDHIPTTGHMVHLINSFIKFEKKQEQYYREINKDTLYCFKCKKVFTPQELSDHWTEEHCTGIKAEIEESEKNPKKIFTVNSEENKATCKICKETIDYTFMKLYHHKKTHQIEKKSDEEVDEDLQPFMIYDHGKRRSELKEFGKTNYIKLISGGAKGYCSICNAYLSSHMTIFKQHVKGAIHNAHLELKGLIKKTSKPEKVDYRSISFKQFCKRIDHVKDSTVYCINDEVFIEGLNLMVQLPIPHKNEIKCFLCDESYPQGSTKKHLTLDHKDKILNTKVITPVTRDFIREIRPGLFHCGSCNQVLPGWKFLDKHFRSWRHRGPTMQMHQTIEQVLKTLAISVALNPNRYSDFIEEVDILN